MQVQKPKNPLTPEQITQLKAQTGEIETLKKQIALAKQAGVNTDEIESQLNDIEALHKKQLAVYGNPANFA